MRVLVLSPYYPPQHGGIQLVVHSLVKHWRRVEARVVTSVGHQAESFDLTEPVGIRRIRPPWALGHRGGMAALNGAALLEARKFPPHVTLSAHIITAPSAWAIGRLQKTPFVQYLHAHELAARPRLARFALGQARASVAVSHHTEELALACHPTPHRLVRIPPGVDLPEVLAGERSQRPVVVTIARMNDRYKGHDVMLRAIDLVRARVPEVQWVVVGDGSLRPEYEQLAHEFGLERHVQFVGSVSDAERDAWLDRAQVFAMPSRVPPGGGGEGFGIVYLEAAAHGVPVVAGKEGGALDAVVDGHTGILVDPTDHVAVANAIGDLMLDTNRAEALGRAGAERAREFSWPQIARAVEDLLIEVARGQTDSRLEDDQGREAGAVSA
ncbi:MAG: glycosyltransferase family 4 protein [Actinomycetota bacterium]|nr:glycosyltransferase family 4 protein [Actinomycetota bacterium]